MSADKPLVQPTATVESAEGAADSVARKRGFYVSRYDCGCYSAVVVDDPRWPQDTANAVAEMIRDGRVVERVEAETIDIGGRCPHRAALSDQHGVEGAGSVNGGRS